LQTRQGAVMYN